MNPKSKCLHPSPDYKIETLVYSDEWHELWQVTEIYKQNNTYEQPKFHPKNLHSKKESKLLEA